MSASVTTNTLSSEPAIVNRKKEHLKICIKKPVEFQHKTAWFEYIELIHQSIPTVAKEKIDLSTEFLGRSLDAPFIIGAMTGGSEISKAANKSLARIAQTMNIGLAIGSQRAMAECDYLTDTYFIRDVAPDVLLLGNIGISQAAKMNTDEVVHLLESIGADGICLHLNAAMELFQVEGDRLPCNAMDTIQRLVKVLGKRLIVKETGCGISKETALILQNMGIQTIDVSGAGGTSWVRVENFRNMNTSIATSEFEEWGIPTAASLCELSHLQMRKIASGGIRSGLDLAKCIALGADIGCAALPILRVFYTGGQRQVKHLINLILSDLRNAMTLTGCRNLKDLQKADVVFLGPLLQWIIQRNLAVRAQLAKVVLFTED